MKDPQHSRIKTFSDRHLWLGPAVWILAVFYFLAQVFVGWVFRPSYSVVTNYISDLGNTACARYEGAMVCSPRHAVMNIAFIGLGVVMAVGSLLMYQEFREEDEAERRAALVGFSCLALSGVGAVLVGCSPENTNHTLHYVGAALAIGVGNLGIFVLGCVLPVPEALRQFMLFFAALSIVALICFAGHHYFGLGKGGMERIAAYPETIWMIRFGMYMTRNHYSHAAVRPPPERVPRRPR
ncbi:MAG TPA: DUF998 domain-containing protein [Acidimicrobiales bacterium]|nr:DUF998 domain-containing protein [Acidimicrobiales bacterium]